MKKNITSEPDPISCPHKLLSDSRSRNTRMVNPYSFIFYIFEDAIRAVSEGGWQKH